jgi:hypothetical protein
VSERAGQGRRALDEALRLLDVLQAARPPAPGAVPPSDAPADASASASADPAADPAGAGTAAHASGECAICPVCRGIAHLRRADPDAVDRIAGAVADLGAALRDLLGAERPAPAPGQGADDAGSHPGGRADAVHPPVHRVDVQRVEVQRIDVTDA